MARDKARDDKFFNQSQESEINYVSALYENREAVREFLENNQAVGKYSTHMEIYQLIEKQLGFPVPF